nr:MAG TPA: TIGR02452 family protein [Caudoviricetes sp.]
MKPATVSRRDNVEEFKNTIRMCSNDKVLHSRMDTMKRRTKLYEPDEIIKIASDYKKGPCKIYLTSKTVITVAKELSSLGPTTVLSFGSATNPGGGVTYGSKAQEECICRSTPLYAALNQKKFLEKFYMVHKLSKNALYSDRMIYVPDVPVLKSDVPIWDPKKKKGRLYSYNPNERFYIDVITACAPNLRALKNISSEEIDETIRNRIRRIIKISANENIDSLILGAFGCGVFQNDPEIVANIFNEILHEKDENGIELCDYFKTVAFAVRNNGKIESKNYEGFKKVFPEESHD